MSTELRELGVVKFYNPRKGYGFVTRSDGGDVFFHLSHFRTATTPAPGCVVSFLVGENREGLTAEDIALAGPEEVDRYEGRIEQLDDEGGLIVTPDKFEVRFRRSDFVPHSRAESLRVGDEVEMNFLIEEEGVWRAAVVRPENWNPEPVTWRTERRESDDEEENRRLLGILYKTDLDDEALHAAGLLAERNMRATLSALVSRLLDRRLQVATRRELIDRLGQVYFDDEVQRFLDQMTEALAQMLEDQETEGGAGATEALRLLLDDNLFPVRWTQYLLPFGLTLLRNLACLPAGHSRLQDAAVEGEAEKWLQRVCRHVEQRRSGHGYVLTTAITTFDGLWAADLLHGPLRRCLARLLASQDAEGLANQLHHLRDKLSPGFLTVFLPALAQHPLLAEALAGSGAGEAFASWAEALLRDTETPSTELLAALLPLLQDIRTRATDDDLVQRLMQPVTAGLTAPEVLRLLRDEDLPERSGWACLWHLQANGELELLLSDPEARGEVTRWLARAAERATPATASEPQLNTALKLVESLRGRVELHAELSGIGANLFAGVHQRIERASPRELVAMLEQFQPGELPGLTAALARRLADDGLDDNARRRVVAWFAEMGPPLSELAPTISACRRTPEDRAVLNDLVSALCASEATGDPEVAGCAVVARELLKGLDVTWLEGFVSELRPGPEGQAKARIQGVSMLVPQRLFADPADFCANRYVRLLLRRGIALGVQSAAAPETGYVCGVLDEPLSIDERDAVVGVLRDLHGGLCYFELANLKSGGDRPLDEGDLVRFTRMPAVGEQPYGYVAFNLHAAFGRADLALLVETLVEAGDEAVAVAAGRTALALSDEGAMAVWATVAQRLSPPRREALEAALDEAALAKLESLAS